MPVFLRYSANRIYVTFIQTDRVTDKHFLKTWFVDSLIPKSCKSFKNKNSKIFINPTLSSCLEESKYVLYKRVV